MVDQRRIMILLLVKADMGIEGFEEGLIGMKKGETKELTLYFAGRVQ